MTYLYGDSSPFPLDDNFVETLRSLVESCAPILRVSEALEASAARWDEARKAAEAEQTRLEALARAVTGAVDGCAPTAGMPAAAQVLDAARGALDAARREAAARRDRVLAEIEATVAANRAAIPVALERFWSAKELPGTLWTLHWIAPPGARARARGLATTDFGLETHLEIDLPLSHLFADAFPLGELERGLTLGLPRPVWHGGRIRPRSTRLDAYFLAELLWGPDQASLVVRRRRAHASPGFEIVFSPDGRTRPTARHLGAGGEALGDATPLDGVDATTAQRLWARLAEMASDLCRRRRRLTGATLDGDPVQDLQRPAELVERIVRAVTPLVREIRQRAGTPGEFVLKRDVVPGRREEVYVKRDDLTRELRPISEAGQAVFAPLGLCEPGADAVDEKEVELEELLVNTPQPEVVIGAEA